MTQKRTSHEKRRVKPRGFAGDGKIPVFCAHDEIVPASSLKLWSEQPGAKNPQLHPAAQLDRYETVVAGNGFRRAAVRSTRSGCITKGNGLVQMARRRGWSVPIENQQYTTRAEELRDVAADNQLAKLAQTDNDALSFLLDELETADRKFAAVSEAEFDELKRALGQLGDDTLTELQIPDPPKMAWVLIGLPLTRLAEIQPSLDTLAAVDGIFLETAANDTLPKANPADDDGQEDR
jgi:hypothetical protein